MRRYILKEILARLVHLDLLARLILDFVPEGFSTYLTLCKFWYILNK